MSNQKKANHAMYSNIEINQQPIGAKWFHNGLYYKLGGRARVFYHNFGEWLLSDKNPVEMIKLPQLPGVR